MLPDSRPRFLRNDSRAKRREAVRVSLSPGNLLVLAIFVVEEQVPWNAIPVARRRWRYVARTADLFPVASSRVRCGVAIKSLQMDKVVIAFPSCTDLASKDVFNLQKA